MKTVIITFLASLALAVSATAAPMLRVETTIAPDGGQAVSAPSVVVESGKMASIEIGNQESALTLAITPTLLDNGQADIKTVITQRKGKQTDTLAAPRLLVQLGKLAKIEIGKLVFTAKPTLVE